MQQRAVIELKALRILCDILHKTLQDLSLHHPLLVYQDKTIPLEEKRRLLLQFYIEFGPKEIDRTDPTPEHKVHCFTQYRFALITAITIEKAKQWGNLPKA